MRWTSFVLAAAVMTAAVSPAFAQEEIQAAPVSESSSVSHAGSGGQLGPWNKGWSLLFSLRSFLAASTFLTDAFNGFGVGGEYYLAPDLAVRVGLDLHRFTDPATVTKNVNTTPAGEVTSYTVSAPGTTAEHNVNVRADVLTRLLATAIAPYAGAGVFFNWNNSQRKFKDDVSVENQVSEVNNRTNVTSAGVRGILGAEWRFHENISLFAEYALGVAVFQNVNVKNRSSIENTASGASAITRSRSESDKTSWFNFDTALDQGGTLGLKVLF